MRYKIRIADFALNSVTISYQQTVYRKKRDRLKKNLGCLGSRDSLESKGCTTKCVNDFVGLSNLMPFTHNLGQSQNVYASLFKNFGFISAAD